METHAALVGQCNGGKHGVTALRLKVLDEGLIQPPTQATPLKAWAQIHGQLGRVAIGRALMEFAGIAVARNDAVNHADQPRITGEVAVDSRSHLLGRQGLFLEGHQGLGDVMVVDVADCDLVAGQEGSDLQLFPLLGSLLTLHWLLLRCAALATSSYNWHLGAT